jgi:hypothetical protein
MHDTLNNGAVLEKTLELCGTIVQQSAFQSLKAHIESFLANDEAKELYRTVAEKGEYLHRSGIREPRSVTTRSPNTSSSAEALLRTTGAWFPGCPRDHAWRTGHRDEVRHQNPRDWPRSQRRGRRVVRSRL